MNIQRAKKVSQETKEYHLKKKKRINIEIRPATFNRIKSDAWYQPEEIKCVAACIMESQDYDFDTHFKIIEENNEFLEWCKCNMSDLDSSPYFFVCNSQNHWAVFSVIKLNDKVVVLFKDSRGKPIYPEITDVVLQYSNNRPHFKSHTIVDQKHPNNCGAMAVKNMEIMLSCLKRVQDTHIFIQNFDYIKFCSDEDLEDIKEQFRTAVLQHVMDNIFVTILDLSKEHDFTMHVNTLIDLCYQFISLRDCHSKYVQTIIEESNKKTDNPGYCIDESKIEGAKSKFFKDKKMEELVKKTIKDANANSAPVGKNADFELDIQKKFQKQMKQFSELFEWFMNVEDDVEREKLLKQVSDKLGLSHDKVNAFFELQRTKGESSKQQEDKVQNEGVTSIEQLIEDMPMMEDASMTSANDASDVKDVDQLLEELLLDACCSDQHNRRERVNDLKRSLERVHDAWNKRWKTADPFKVRSWAQSRRQRATKMDRGVVEGRISGEEVEEVLAVIYRAHQLASGGQRLRNPQLLAVLVCLLDERSVLCQMATGEGKTAVVSVLAAAEVLLRNRQVDVVTTNEVLAVEGYAARKTFLELLSISAATNVTPPGENRGERDGARSCYAADVVYGSLADFQFDFLYHGCEGRGTRGKRSFGRVIVDEVDSMLIDNGGHIAMLASPFPGFDSLRYIHMNIWKALFKAEKDIVINIEHKLEEEARRVKDQCSNDILNLNKEFENFVLNISGDQNINETIQKKGKVLSQKRNENQLRYQREYEQFRSKVYKEEIDSMKQKIKDAKPTQVNFIPAHLRDYAAQMEDKWIENAMYARFQCCENEQYVLRTLKDSKETVVVPVDYNNTGITLKNTQWVDGLHQFVQLKHNLRVVPESMTSSFISNVGYINLYENRIWGLTGTLGSLAEMKLLADAYNVNCAKIPTYKIKKFQEFQGIVTTDSQWANVVSMDAILNTLQRRSVLIICKTIREVMFLEKNIRALLKLENLQNTKVKTYADEDSCRIVDEVVGPKEIIIATNIAGRGTDLKTSQELEEVGGLHVCVSFLPANQRVEDQAFGRTSRQGNIGSAQLIICESDVIELGLKIEPDMEFQSIKKKRDQLEQKRIVKLQNNKLDDTKFHDEIFIEFSNLYSNFNKMKKSSVEIIFLARDLKELWAFWLHEKNFKKNKKTRRNAKIEFEEFKTAAGKILGKKINGEYYGGEISHNPYYSIFLAEHYLNIRSLSKSKNALSHAIELDSRNKGILHSAHFKLFEIAIENGHQLLERFRVAMIKAVGIDLLKFPIFEVKDTDGIVKKSMKGTVNIFNSKQNEDYKNNAKRELEKAKSSLEMEINYINVNLLGSYFPRDSQNGDNFENTGPPTNQDFLNILISNDNHLLKQIQSRFIVLDTFYRHVTSLLENVEQSIGKDGIAITSRVPNYLKTEIIKKDSSMTAMLEPDVMEIANVGLDTIYSLRKVYDVPEQVIRRAQAQIALGLTTLGAGICFPPALFVAGPVASTFISEGICDIAVELISAGNSEFSEAAYIKGKTISYAISAITCGLSALAQCVNILDEAIRCCKSLSNWLRKCTRFQSVCEKVAQVIDKIQMYFVKLKFLAEMSKIRSTVTAVSRSQMACSIMKSTGKTTLKSLLGSLVTEKIVSKLLENLLHDLKPEIEEVVAKFVNEKITKEDLKGINNVKLQKLINEIMIGTYGEIACDILKEVALGLLRYCQSWKAKITAITIDTIISVQQIRNFLEEFCHKLKIQLKNESQKINEDKEKNNESCDEKLLKKHLITALTEKIYGLIMQLTGKYANTFIVHPFMEKTWNYFDSSSEEAKKISEEEEKNFHEILEALELLGLEYGASDEEINEAWKKSLQNICDSQDMDNSSEQKENIEKFMQLMAAKQLLHNLNEERAFLIQITNYQTPTHAGNIETLSDEEKRCFIIINSETGEETVFGEQYKNNGKKEVRIGYHPPTENSDGHYYILTNSGDATATPSGKYNCFYDVYAAICQSQGINMTPGEARLKAEQWSWSNVKYNTLDALSGLLNNALTKDLYLKCQRSLLVGGREPLRPLGVNEEYPIYLQLTNDKHEKQKMKETLTELLNYLSKMNKRYQIFNPNKVDSNRLRRMGYTVPSFGSDDNKERFMTGAIFVKFSDGTEVKFLSSSGSDVFYIRSAVDFDTGASDPLSFNYEKNGYVYQNPGNIIGKKIFDLKNRKYSTETFNRNCAAQKLFFLVGEHMQEKMKTDPYLKVTGIQMGETLFEKCITTPLSTKDVHYIASCTPCAKSLPFCTGKDSQ